MSSDDVRSHLSSCMKRREKAFLVSVVKSQHGPILTREKSHKLPIQSILHFPLSRRFHAMSNRRVFLAHRIIINNMFPQHHHEDLSVRLLSDLLSSLAEPFRGHQLKVITYTNHEKQFGKLAINGMAMGAARWHIIKEGTKRYQL